MNLGYVGIRAEYTERKCRLRNEKDESLEHVIERCGMAGDKDLNWVEIVNLAYK